MRAPASSPPDAAFGSQDGFTLVEAVLVIAILGALAAVSAPRFFGTREFEEAVFLDQTNSALRYAQKLAVATGCEVQVTIAGNAFTLRQQPACTGGGFTQDVIDPATGASSYSRSAPTGVSLTSDVSPFVFDALGRARDGVGTVTDVLVSVGPRSLRVVGETGFVDAL